MNEKEKAISLFLFELESSFDIGIDAMSHMETILPLFYDVAFRAGYRSNFIQSKQVIKLQHNEIIDIYPSAHIAATANELSSSTIIGNCNNWHKSRVKGIRYMYLEDYDKINKNNKYNA